MRTRIFKVGVIGQAQRREKGVSADVVQRVMMARKARIQKSRRYIYSNRAPITFFCFPNPK